jgi:GMP synthase PP-ATPase subunit
MESAFLMPPPRVHFPALLNIQPNKINFHHNLIMRKKERKKISCAFQKAMGLNLSVIYAQKKVLSA